MLNLQQVKDKYLAEALAKPVRKFGVDLGNGSYTSLSDFQGFYAEQCAESITAKVDKKYLRGDKVTDEAPLEVVSGPAGFLGDKALFAFTTPDLKENNLKVEIIDKPLIGKATVKFPDHHNFAIRMEPIVEKLYQSSDGKYYESADLPERDNDFCTEKYAGEIKAERNARISDTDDYIRLTDITVQETAGAKRSALSDTAKDELLTYRQELRDMPSKDGFPFIEFPAFPESLAYELEAKVKNRKQMMERNR